MPSRPHAPAAGYEPGFVDAVLAWALALPAPDGRPPVFGLAGLQGSGKSTLSTQLALAATLRGKRVEVLSIDDFYLHRGERQALARRVHPLLGTRGPPGTHDVALACRTIDALQTLAGLDTVRIPRFDKIADRRLPPSRWTPVRERPDLIVFEGWLLKVPPESEAALARPLNVLERDEDPDGTWRDYCNRALAGYQPLWDRLDFLLFLRGPGFERVPAWRWEQERALQAKHPQRQAMGRAAVERFVLFFERVSRQAQRTLPEIADRTVAIDAQRRPELP